MTKQGPPKKKVKKKAKSLVSAERRIENQKAMFEESGIKPAEPQNLGGRPTLYKDEYCEILRAHLASGLSFDCAPAKIPVNIDTLYEWLKVHKRFSDAHSQGLAQGQEFLETIGLTGAANKLAINANAWKFLMQNRFGWRSREDITSGDKPISPPQVIITLPPNGREIDKESE